MQLFAIIKAVRCSSNDSPDGQRISPFVNGALIIYPTSSRIMYNLMIKFQRTAEHELTA